MRSLVEVGVRVHPRPPFSSRRADIRRWRSQGVRAFWWPDHLMAFATGALWSESATDPGDDTRLHSYTDPFVSIAACADAVPDALLGICVTDAVRRMPATLVQAALTLDHLAPGRIVLGLGSGESANYAPYGWWVDSPNRRLVEAAATIRFFLDAPGPDSRGAVVGLRPPPGSMGPRLWLAAHGPRGLEATGRYADGWIPTFLDPPAWMAARTAVQTAAAEQGRDPAAITMALSANVALAESHDAAHALLEHPAIKLHALLLPGEAFTRHDATHPLAPAGMTGFVPTLEGPRLAAAARTVPFDVVHDVVPHGSPEEVAGRLMEYEGLQHVRLSDIAPAADRAMRLESDARTLEVARILAGEGSPDRVPA